MRTKTKKYSSYSRSRRRSSTDHAAQSVLPGTTSTQTLDAQFLSEMAQAYAPEYIHYDELKERVKTRPRRRRSKAPEVETETNRRAEDIWQSERAPLNFWGRMAIRFAPLFSSFYDLQMSMGKGVRPERHRLSLANYPRQAASLKIAFLSDLHMGPTSGRVAIRQAWNLARKARPDVLLLGGDFLYADERGLPALLRELQRWKRDAPPGGMYACLGKHDYEAGSDTLIMALEACGVRVLINEAVELPEPWKGVWIGGTDDPLTGDAQPVRTLAEVPADDCVVLMAHSPEVCAHEVVKRCDLTVCGGTHGGQICWPNGEALRLNSEWARNYQAGMHRLAGNWLFVSRGIGTAGVPLRLWSPPDVGLFEIAERRYRF